MIRIEPQWNVNDVQESHAWREITIRIEPQWNVNTADFVDSGKDAALEQNHSGM